MASNVKITQWPETIEVARGQTILEAALASGVPYPHGCRSGNCGACRSRLLSGSVDMAPYSAYALSPADQAAGLVLACRARPQGDVEVAWTAQEEGGEAAHPIRKLAATVAGLDTLTHDIRRVRLQPPTGPLAFSAGQYVSLTFAGCKPRDYSMANRPDDPVLEFHIRATATGMASAYVHEHLALGDRVIVEGPFGTSHLRERHRGPILAIAGGSGLAPIMSIVETALAKDLPQPIYLYFGARDEHDVYAEARMQELAAAHPRFRFTVVLSEPSAPTNRRVGLVHAAVAADFDDLDGCKAYLAGPPAMVEAAVDMLEMRDMRVEDIHADAFYTEADKAAVAS